MSAATLRIAGCLCAATMLGILVGCGDAKNSEAAAKAPSVPGQAFASPEEAAAALVSAAEKYDVPTLYALKGEIVSRGVKAITGFDMPVYPKRR